MTTTDAEAIAREGNRIWFDTEFIEDGTTIDLISIGMVRSDGATYYAETDQWIPGKASQWVKENVIVHLRGGDAIKPRDVIAREIVEFVGEDPEFWAYYADYDWVALCQLFGTMMQLPSGWPKFCRDIKQMAVDLGNPQLPKQNSVAHHALADALWSRGVWDYLASRREAEPVAWLHPTAGWSNADYDFVYMHCLRDGPKPIPLYTAPPAPVPAPAGEVERLRGALEIIAGERQCIDNLMSNADVARAALNGGGANDLAPVQIHFQRRGGANV